MTLYTHSVSTLPVTSHEFLAVPARVGASSRSMKARPWMVVPGVLGAPAWQVIPCLVSSAVAPQTSTLTPGKASPSRSRRDAQSLTQAVAQAVVLPMLGWLQVGLALSHA